MDIRDNPEKHRYEAVLADGSIAVSEYKLSPGKIILTHTEVPPEHEGEGIASALTDRYRCAKALTIHNVFPLSERAGLDGRRRAEGDDRSRARRRRARRRIREARLN